VPLALSVPATLTGVGSVPGTDVAQWASRITDHLPDFPHVPELPERGPGADMIGRTLGLLSEITPDFAAATTVTGWELAAPGRDMRRARALLREDLDAVEQAWQGHTGPAKQQLAGPYTIAAAVERKGRRLLADPGIVRDLVTAWREMLSVHRRELVRRLAADWVVQMDEPSLPAVVAGSVSTISGMSAYPPIEPALDLGAELIHCCAPGVPLTRLRGCGGILFDLSLHEQSVDEQLAELSTGGTVLGFGVSPVAGSVRSVLDFFDRTGLHPAPMLITPPCGMVADYRPWRPLVDDLNERLA
jgi:hypothetical protein